MKDQTGSARDRSAAHIYIPAPEGDSLEAFPGTFRTKPKTRFPGGKRRRWKDDDGTIYEWDYLHGRVEKWNRRGDTHMGDFSPVDGTMISPPDPSRRKVEP